MRAIGFNFKKIKAESFEGKTEKINIKTNIDISEIKEVEKNILNTKEDILQVIFKYKVNYEPKFADIVVEGSTLISLEPKLYKEVLKQWKKKQMPEDFRLFLFNLILRKASLKALNLEDELNLPLHLPMPSFKKSQDKE